MANVCEPVALCTPQFVFNKKYFQYKCNKRWPYTASVNTYFLFSHLVPFLTEVFIRLASAIKNHSRQHLLKLPEAAIKASLISQLDEELEASGELHS